MAIHWRKHPTCDMWHRTRNQKHATQEAFQFEISICWKQFSWLYCVGLSEQQNKHQTKVTHKFTNQWKLSRFPRSFFLQCLFWIYCELNSNVIRKNLNPEQWSLIHALARGKIFVHIYSTWHAVLIWQYCGIWVC